MPRKRQSQPMQVWLATKDLRRLVHAAQITGRSQSDLAREGILRVLDELEKAEREHNRMEALFRKFSNGARDVVMLAKQESEISYSSLVATQHVLLALAVDPAIGAILQKHGASSKVLRAAIATGPNFESAYGLADKAPYSPRVVHVIDRARTISARLLDKWVQPEHLLLSVLDQGNGSAFELLEHIGAPLSEIRAAVMKHITACRKERRWKRKG